MPSGVAARKVIAPLLGKMRPLIRPLETISLRRSAILIAQLGRARV